MKDIFGAFGSEVFRPLVTLLFPGALALLPWAALLLCEWEQIRKFADANHAETATAFALASLFVGLLLEEAGSWLEVRIDGKLNATPKRRASHYEHFSELGGEDEWYEYLRLAFTTEPVGHRYLRTLVQRLKFELHTTAATPVVIVGAVLLPIPWPLKAFVVITFSLLAAWLHHEAGSTAALLKRHRTNLLKGIRVPVAGGK